MQENILSGAGLQSANTILVKKNPCLQELNHPQGGHKEVHEQEQGNQIFQKV